MADEASQNLQHDAVSGAAIASSLPNGEMEKSEETSSSLDRDGPAVNPEAPAAMGRWVRLARWRKRAVAWLWRFAPASVGIDGRELLRVIGGVVLCMASILLVGVFWLQPGTGGPWMLASFGTSALLVIAMPSSPLSQPWPVLGGSALAVLLGAVCAVLFPGQAWAAALAVAVTVAAMVPLRCLHPPGAALALHIVLQGGVTGTEGGLYVIVNAMTLLAVALVYNPLTKRSYPARRQQRQEAPKNAAMARFSSSDLDEALDAFNQVLDVSRADLEELLHRAGHAAFKRTLGDLRCAQIMSHPPFAVEAGVSLRDAWAVMRRENVKALPVIDSDHRVLGIITQSDFMRLVDLTGHDGIGERLKTLFRGRKDRPSKVGEVMAHPVVMSQVNAHAMELMPLFSKGRRYHIPIVDDQRRLVGIVTQTDLLHALSAAIPGVSIDAAH